MSSTATPVVVRSTPASLAASWAARAVLGLVGAVGVWAATYFSYFATMEDGRVSGPVDWAVAVWSMALAVGYLIVAVRLGDRTRRTLQMARGLVIAHIVFGLVKLFGYGEVEPSLIFFSIDLLILGLLAVGRRPR